MLELSNPSLNTFDEHPVIATVHLSVAHVNVRICDVVLPLLSFSAIPLLSLQGGPTGTLVKRIRLIDFCHFFKESIA